VSIVEVTTFRLVEGVTAESFLVLDRRMQTELVPNQPGFMRRTTARHGDDWLVVTLWSTEDAAAAFERATADHLLQTEFARGMEPGTFHLTRYVTLD
jgi:heme-degrading monooxygenase HmoA